MHVAAAIPSMFVQRRRCFGIQEPEDERGIRAMNGLGQRHMRELLGMTVPTIESDRQAQDAATGVADVVSGAHRHITDVTRHELFGYRVPHPHINSHLSCTLKIVLPLVGVGVPVKLTNGSRLDLQHGGG
jgi:hypothetical protein